jgi:hypothetical protein
LGLFWAEPVNRSALKNPRNPAIQRGDRTGGESGSL